jgi:hypothetical protein
MRNTFAAVKTPCANTPLLSVLNSFLSKILLIQFLRSSGCDTAPEKKSFEELIALYAVRDDSNWPVARAYLSETRKIDPAIVDEMHAVGSIYANDHRPNPSLVFLHRDPPGKVRGATLRGHQASLRVPPVPWEQAQRVVHGRESR